MIKHICFDLDGVLCDAREIHYEALNRALEKINKKYIIDRESHLSTYDGLPTNKKLKLLTLHRDLPEKYYNVIWQEKQNATIDIISNEIKQNYRLMGLLDQLKKENYIISVASNSIRKSVKMMLLRTGLLEFVDFYYSNQDVKNPKPNSEMYLKCIIKAGVNTKETLIIEDSHIGRTAALNSGAYLCAVKDVEDVTYEKIINRITEINKENEIRPKWQGGKMNVLIPMAGENKSFIENKYPFPKYLAEIKNKTLIELVINNLNIEANYIFVVKKEEYEKYNLKFLLDLLTDKNEIIILDKKTNGALDTVLEAREFINNDNPLIIANCDQLLDWNSNQFLYSSIGDSVEGSIVTFKSTLPKYSYIRLDDNGFVNEVKEKQVISNIATAGIYYYSSGKRFVDWADEFKSDENNKTNNEWYIAPVFNIAIKNNYKIKQFPIDKMHCIGDYNSYKQYIENLSE